MSDFLESWHKKRDKVILFAGVFDPIHKGHMAIAKKALEWGQRVISLPEQVPTHKHGATSYEHRRKMIELAIVDEPDVEVWDTPFEHHTIRDTLSFVRSKLPKDQPIALLFGADVASHIMSWPDSNRLADFGVTEVIFADRATDVLDTDPQIPGVKVSIIRSGEHAHLSSTLIRQKFSEYMTSLPKAVAEYAKEQKLY